MKRTVLESGRTVMLEASEGRFLTTESLTNFGLVTFVPIEDEYTIIEVDLNKNIIPKPEDKIDENSMSKEEKISELDNILETINALTNRVNQIKRELNND